MEFGGNPRFFCVGRFKFLVGYSKCCLKLVNLTVGVTQLEFKIVDLFGLIAAKTRQ